MKGVSWLLAGGVSEANYIQNFKNNLCQYLI